LLPSVSLAQADTLFAMDISTDNNQLAVGSPAMVRRVDTDSSLVTFAGIAGGTEAAGFISASFEIANDFRVIASGLTFTLTTVGDTATIPDDLPLSTRVITVFGTNGIVTRAQFASAAQTTFPIVNDQDTENDEVFSLSVSAATDGLNFSPLSLVIVNDDFDNNAPFPWNEGCLGNLQAIAGVTDEVSLNSLARSQTYIIDFEGCFYDFEGDALAYVIVGNSLTAPALAASFGGTSRIEINFESTDFLFQVATVDSDGRQSPSLTVRGTTSAFTPLSFTTFSSASTQIVRRTGTLSSLITNVPNGVSGSCQSATTTTSPTLCCNRIGSGISLESCSALRPPGSVANAAIMSVVRATTDGFSAFCVGTVLTVVTNCINIAVPVVPTFASIPEQVVTVGARFSIRLDVSNPEATTNAVTTTFSAPVVSDSLGLVTFDSPAVVFDPVQNAFTLNGVANAETSGSFSAFVFASDPFYTVGQSVRFTVVPACRPA